MNRNKILVFLIPVSIIVLILLVFVFKIIPYDKRFTTTSAVIFEDGNKTLICSISIESKPLYSGSKRNSYRMSSAISYFLQINDAASGEVLKRKKIVTASDLKDNNLVLLGKNHNVIWLFMDGLRGINANTLEEDINIQKLEEKNPSLKNQFPTECKYYHFIVSDTTIYFTARNGNNYALNLNTYKAENVENQMVDSLLQQNNNLPFVNKISLVNTEDTFNNKWYGIYANGEIKKSDKYFNPSGYFSFSYDAEVKRQLYTSSFIETTNLFSNEKEIKFDWPTIVNDKQYFLQAAFLKDKYSKMALHLHDPNGYILVHKSAIGDDALVCISRIDLNGKVLWTITTPIKKMLDLCTNINYLVLLGSSTNTGYYFIDTDGNSYNYQQDLLVNISLQSGKMAVYNYQEDKVQ